jgi:hypothetical protein
MLPGTEVEFVFGEGGVLLRKPDAKSRRPSPRAEKLGAAIDRLRGSATIRMTTEEIMALTRGE